MMILIWPAFVIEVLQGGVRQECETMSAQKNCPHFQCKNDRRNSRGTLRQKEKKEKKEQT